MLQTKIANIDLDSYVANASGVLDSDLNELIKIAQSDSAAVVMKSCTLEPRKGNEEPRYARLKYGAIQSMGLPNLGYKKYISFAAALKKYKKPIIASVAGLKPADFPLMVKDFQKSPADLIEVNLSCPNIEGKPQLAYDFTAAEKILKSIFYLGEKPIGLKLPAYFDIYQYQIMSKLILKYRIAFITCINSIGNTLFIDAEKEASVIKPKGGLGGLCGQYIKPIALANVRNFYKLLSDRVSIFGVGGVSSGTDAFEFLLAAADAVQVGSAFEKEGSEIFTKIKKQLARELKKHGYKNILQAKGKLITA